MGFSRQEHWSGLPCSPPGDFPDSGTKSPSPVTPALQVDSLSLSHRRSPMTWHKKLEVFPLLQPLRLCHFGWWGPSSSFRSLNLSGSQCLILSLSVVLFRHKNSVCIINHLERNLDFYRESVLSQSAGRWELCTHFRGGSERTEARSMYLRSPEDHLAYPEARGHCGYFWLS